MAIFGKNKKKEAEKAVAKVDTTTTIAMGRDLSHVLKHARITEKATMHSADSVYTFDIAEHATKRDVIQAVRALYKVTPRSVRVVTIPSKARRNARTGKLGVKQGGRKAYVYLKKGEVITIGYFDRLTINNHENI